MIIETPNKPIGVSVSGGADSALLLYLLMSNHNDKIYICTTAAENKYHRNANRVPGVIKYCSERTGHTNYEHRVTPVYEQTLDNVTADLKDLLHKDIISCYYNGTTKNPPPEVVSSFVSKDGPVDNRTPDGKRPEKLFDGKINIPFANIDKKGIAALYEENNLMDLFVLTSSCEWQDDTMKHLPGIDPKVEQCGHCWWCEERQWGFGRL